MANLFLLRGGARQKSMSSDSRGTRFYGLFRFQIGQKTKKIEKKFQKFPEIFPKIFFSQGRVSVFLKIIFDRTLVKFRFFGPKLTFLAYLGPKLPSRTREKLKSNDRFLIIPPLTQ